MKTPDSPAPASPAVADVCLILEGTFPYVQGGVSSWVNQVITGLPELTFAIHLISSTHDPERKMRYKVPENVTEIRETFLFNPPVEAKRSWFRKRPDKKARAEFFEALRQLSLAESQPERARIFHRVHDAFRAVTPRMNFGDLCRDEESWNIVADACKRTDGERPFDDFYWSVRNIAQQTWRILSTASEVPDAKVYHCCSTGYAGLLGAVVARERNAPLLLTEHGIYTKERIIEVSANTHIGDPEQLVFDPEGLRSSLKSIWINFFELLGRLTYDRSELILTLFEGNGRLQRDFGAEDQKVVVMPNGIRPSDFAEIRRKREARLAEGPPAHPVVGFVGRVVPIKDVKTLIRAASIVVAKLPEVRFHIVGPQEEDPEYVRECRALITSLGIDKQVLLLGPKKLADFLHELDVMVLTSVSEGQPLTILEAFAAAIPCVVTNVGSCAELVLGRTAVDRLGPAGRVTPAGAPRATAEALLDVLETPGAMRALGEVGLERVRAHYVWDDILAHYRDYYTGLPLGKSFVEPASTDAPRGDNPQD